MARCGQVERSIEGVPVLITIHPSAILRGNTEPLRQRLGKDLLKAAQMLQQA